MLRLPSIDKGSKCREGVRYGASAENFAEKAARAAQPGGGFALGAGSDCLLGRARVLPERVQRGVSGAAGAACADRAAGEAAGAVRAAPAARPDGGDCGAVPARRLHRPARDGGAAAPERVIEAGIQEETKTPAATNRRRSSRQSPIYPTPNRNPRHPLTSIRSRKHRPPLNRKFPPLPRPIPRRRSRPRPPCSRRRSTLPRRARNTTERAAATCKRARFPSHSTTRRQRVTPPASPAADKTTQKDPSDGKFPVRRVFGSIGIKSAA